VHCFGLAKYWLALRLFQPAGSYRASFLRHWVGPEGGLPHRPIIQHRPGLNSPRQLPLAPMPFLASRIEDPLDVAVERTHDADPRKRSLTAPAAPTSTHSGVENNGSPRALKLHSPGTYPGLRKQALSSVLSQPPRRRHWLQPM